MFIKLLILGLLIFKIDGADDTMYVNCDFDLLDGRDTTQQQAILAQFPDECKNLSNDDQDLSKIESTKFDEFNKQLRSFDPDVSRVNEYDQFYEPVDILKCNNVNLSYEEYVKCLLPLRNEMIDLIKNPV